ncbi:MAG: hypothetical protein RSF34_21330, partial [Flavobacterium sp.]|uniref:hypothetical protein n=1 Tax=Flavobacterium sp. TaxID=239 RepID=UPI002FCABEF7
SSIEKDLIKLGFEELVKGYQQKLKTNEWTKLQYNDALKSLHTKHKSQISNIGNVNVATRQSFDVDDSMVPLNLQNIQQEFIDYDYIYSTLLFEYNSNNRIHTKALYQLDKLLHENYPDAVILNDEEKNVKQLTLQQLINEATLPFSPENKNYLKTVFTELINRYKNKSG